MHTGSYVNGKWYHPSTAQTTRNINPADTADVIAEFPLAGADDVRLAVDAAVEAAKSWRKTPGPERGRVLWRAADIARRRVDEIAQTLTREEGKILKPGAKCSKALLSSNTTPARAFGCTARRCRPSRATRLPIHCGSRSAPSA